MIVTFFSVYIACSSFLSNFRISVQLKNLCNAILRNDIETIRGFIAKNPNLLVRSECSSEKSFVNRFKVLAFWIAINRGNEEIVELLIDSGADVNGRSIDGDGCVLLHRFAYFVERWESDKRMATVLIRRGADVNASVQCAEDRHPETPLTLAVRYGHVEYVEFLLQNGAKLEGPEWERPYYPINRVVNAPKSKQAQILRVLFDHGLETGFHDRQGRNYIMYIIDLQTVHYPLDLNIDVPGIASTLFGLGLPANASDDDGVSTLTYAVNLQDLDWLSVLIEKGVDVNERSEALGGMLPLFHAVCTGNETVVDFLISNGAEINAKSYNETTALHIACKTRREKMIDLLIHKGAFISEENIVGHTPFTYLDPQEFKESDVTCINAMVKELTKAKFADELALSRKDVDLLGSHPAIRELFENCWSELNDMLRSEFYDGYSYYSVIKMSKSNVKKLVNLTKNEEFVASFDESLHTFACYGNELRRIFDEAMVIRDRLEIVITRLYDLFCDYLDDIVIRKLADNLTVEDLPLD